MTEAPTTPNPNEQPPLSDGSTAAWLAAVDEIAPWDQPVTLHRGPNEEVVRLHDVSTILDESGRARGTVVILERPDGATEDVSVKDFLLWTGQTDETIATAIHNSPSETAKREREARWVAQEAERRRHLFMPMAQTTLGREGKLVLLVTPESESHASAVLAGAVKGQPELERILRGHGMRIDDYLTMVRAIREDPDVRFAVGDYFRTQLDDRDILREMPERIRQNSRKMPVFSDQAQLGDPSQNGLMPSKDYVTLVTLGMLDGTFKHAGQYSSPGEHRDAARLLLTRQPPSASLQAQAHSTTP